VSRILRKIYDRLEQLIGRRLPPPYETAQEYTESLLHVFLHCAPEEIGTILVVGGFVGDEVRRMLPRYPNAKFAIFEPSKKVIPITNQRFADQGDRVTVVNAAVSDQSGQLLFHETDIPGTSSLLPLAAPAVRDYNLKSESVYEVTAVRLDEWILQWKHAPGSDHPIDLIWCDVQGAELQVLRGAQRLLSRTRALFVEISIRERMYEGNVLFRELIDFVKPYGFEPVLIGTDPKSLTGNALLIKPAGQPSGSSSGGRAEGMETEQIGSA